MQKIKVGHRAKFRDRDNFFPQVLFPFRAILRRILRRIFTSGVLHDRNLNHSADACFLVMACVAYSRVKLKTLSSLLKCKICILYFNLGHQRAGMIIICLNHFSFVLKYSCLFLL